LIGSHRATLPVTKMGVRLKSDARGIDIDSLECGMPLAGKNGWGRRNGTPVVVYRKRGDGRVKERRGGENGPGLIPAVKRRGRSNQKGPTVAFVRYLWGIERIRGNLVGGRWRDW